MNGRKILLLNYSYRGGGAARTARELLHALEPAGMRGELWIGTGEGELPVNVRTVRPVMERWVRPFKQICPGWQWPHRGSAAAVAGIGRGACDVVHLHTLSQNWISLPAVGALCGRMPVVWTQHDEWALTLGLECDMRELLSEKQLRELRMGKDRFVPWSRYHENWRYRQRRGFLERVLPQPQVVICPADHLKNRIIQANRFPRARVVKIIHGLPFLDHPGTAMARLECRRRLGLPAEAKLVTLVAGEVDAPHKGLRFAMDALRKLPPEDRPWLLLAGSGGERVARANPDLHVVPVNVADDGDLAALYRAVDVTLVPSLVESLSYVALESLACRTPVVVFRIGGPAEIAGENQRGLVAEAFDVDQYAAYVARLLKDETLRQRFGEAGRKWVEENCAMDVHVKRVGEAYDEAIAACAK